MTPEPGSWCLKRLGSLQAKRRRAAQAQARPAARSAVQRRCRRERATERVLREAGPARLSAILCSWRSGAVFCASGAFMLVYAEQVVMCMHLLYKPRRQAKLSRRRSLSRVSLPPPLTSSNTSNSPSLVRGDR
jgi:hypothetical protein